MRVVVVGGGAAGMMAAIAAAREGARVLLLEKTGRLGFKIEISGGGRCNITNDQGDVRELVKMYPGNGRFLQDALRRHPKDDLLALLARRGVATKVEPPYGKVFPVSDRAHDVVAALEEELANLGVEVRLHAPVVGLRVADGRITGVEVDDLHGDTRAGESGVRQARLVPAGAVVVATGGRSFPRSGSTGDGYAMAEAVGHRVEPTWPSLVPLRVAGTKELSGVALRDVEGTAVVAGKPSGPRFRGDLLFTHFGLSGPIVLQLSRAAADGLRRKLPVELRVDVLPNASFDDVLAQLGEAVGSAARSQVATVLTRWLPRSAVPAFMRQVGVPEERRCAEIKRVEREALARQLKGWRFVVDGWHSIEGAEVTAGGVSVSEVDPRTFQSRKIAGLFWAGEVLDIDGYVGGYNLQAAWSSGWAAGKAAAGLLWAGQPIGLTGDSC